MYLSSFWLLTGPTVPTPTTWTSFRLSTRWSASLMSSPSLVKLMTKQGLELKRPSSKERTRMRPFHDASWFCVAFFSLEALHSIAAFVFSFYKDTRVKSNHDFTKISSTDCHKRCSKLVTNIFVLLYVVMSSW